MLCNICRQPELTGMPDGVKTDSVRPHADPKKSTTAFICAHCTDILSSRTSQINWEMDLDDLKAAVNGARMKRTPRMRRTA